MTHDLITHYVALYSHDKKDVDPYNNMVGARSYKYSGGSNAAESPSGAKIGMQFETSEMPKGYFERMSKS